MNNDDALRHRLRELAGQRKRFGSPRLYIIKRRNLVVNHKRTERIYREECLALRRKRRRKDATGIRVVLLMAMGPNEHWPMDFVSDCIVTRGFPVPWLLSITIPVNVRQSKWILLSEVSGWWVPWINCQKKGDYLKSSQLTTDWNLQERH